MQRQSEEALGLLTNSDEIVASIETHGVEVAALLQEKWTAMTAPPDSTPQVDAPSPPDYLGHLFTLRDGLTASAGSLSQADQTHVHQLAKVIELREDRDDLVTSGYDKLSIMRRTIDDLHGEGRAFVQAGIEGPTSRKANKLLRQIDLAVPRLRAPDLKLKQAKVEGIKVNPVAMADDLETLAGKLRTAQNEFRRARRVVQASSRKKNQQIKDHRRNIVWTARTVEGYYRLAGEDELADRLRPIVRRVSRPQPSEPPAASPLPEETSPEAPDDGLPDDGLPDDGLPDEPPPEESEDEEGSASEPSGTLRTAPSTPDV